MIMSGQMHLGGAADNDLVLPGEKVAPHHALIQKQGLVYKITDLSGENGTFVNGKRITGPTLLKSGDIVLIGDSQLTISDQP
jgi:pSer/pThr/pTyr-binding forkhead associated (FHA) protein